jgi:acyl-CoA thioesterase
MPTAQEVVTHMMKHDLFSQWLGIEVLEINDGYSRIRMTVREEMINGFGIVHGELPFHYPTAPLHLPATTGTTYR